MMKNEFVEAGAKFWCGKRARSLLAVASLPQAGLGRGKR